MKTISVKAVKRADFGKKAAKAIRREGMVPCVLCGNGETETFSVDPREIKPLIYTPNSYIVEFDIEGKKEQAVLREAQFHPVREEILHLDFYRIAEGKPVSIAIPVRLTGNAEGVKVGGKLALSARKLVVSALVENLPDEIVVDVTELGVGKTIFVGDLEFENLKFITPATTAVCAVRVTRASRGAAEAAKYAGNMKYLIVGLGNIGAEYAETRHNIGFNVLDALAEASNTVFTTQRYGDVAEAKYKGRTLVLLKPSTYMNLSGKAVRYWMDAGKIPPENLLVVSDDIALPFGTLRLRPKGSAGGHNGLKNISELLGTEEYARMRFGVGGDFPKGHQVEYVLGEWTDEERKALPERLKVFVDAIRSFATVGTQLTMTNFNKK